MQSISFFYISESGQKRDVLLFRRTYLLLCCLTVYTNVVMNSARMQFLVSCYYGKVQRERERERERN